MYEFHILYNEPQLDEFDAKVLRFQKKNKVLKYWKSDWLIDWLIDCLLFLVQFEKVYS